jgi:hypothetical protein
MSRLPDGTLRTEFRGERAALGRRQLWLFPSRFALCHQMEQAHQGGEAWVRGPGHSGHLDLGVVRTVRNESELFSV